MTGMHFPQTMHGLNGVDWVELAVGACRVTFQVVDAD